MTPRTKPADESLDSSVVALKVAEARSRDVGRGIARLDPADLSRIGAKPGDVLKLVGKKQTVAKAMPAFPEDRGHGAIQVDGLIRDNAGVGLGEKVRIQTTTFKPAQKVRLAPVGALRMGRGAQDSRHVGRLLEGLALSEGDGVRATFFGTRHQDFIAVETVPPGPVVVQAQTAVEIIGREGAKRQDQRVAYEDIGGLQREVRSIREMIELPLKYPEVFAQLGIEPPKGVLLHGPPGCGKTLIARAVASETDAKFFSLRGPEIMHKFYGESEAHLRRIFEQAADGPSIIFLDEIDAIAPKRSALGGEQQVERRVVSQLLALMDGLESRGQVIVIGATNLPEAIDPALRRPGRFDREIVIGVPDKIGRLEMLQIHTRGMPLAEDVDLDRLAQITHGFVGADMQSLCREAAMARLRKILPDIDFELDHVPYETLEGLAVVMDDFLDALASVEPSAIREVFAEVPDVHWDDVGGLDAAKQVLKESIQWPIQHSAIFKKANIAPPKGILLHGPPGVGKTLLAKAVATECGVNFISIKGPALLSKWVGETERAVRDVFHKAKLASPCIIFLDEIDSIAPRRGGSEGTAITDRVIAQLLTEMDGVEELKGVIVLAATNRKDLIDPALLRAGRFDFMLELPSPDRNAQLDIFRIYTRGKPLAEDVSLASLAEEARSGMTGADIELVCRTAATLAIREFLLTNEDAARDCESLIIRDAHFRQALDGVKAK